MNNVSTPEYFDTKFLSINLKLGEKMEKQEKIETSKIKNDFYLWWVNSKTKKRSYAGKAFYNKEKGDYALIINLLENSYEKRRPCEIYLKPISNNNDLIYFRVEKIISRRGKTDRFAIGEAWQCKETENDIVINIEPLTSFYKKLVLTLPETEGKTND